MIAEKRHKRNLGEEWDSGEEEGETPMLIQYKAGHLARLVPRRICLHLHSSSPKGLERSMLGVFYLALRFLGFLTWSLVPGVKAQRGSVSIKSHIDVFRG